MTEPTGAPSLQTIARALDQAIDEQRETRVRLDTHIEISTMRFAGLDSQLESLRSTTTAQFLTLAAQLQDMQKHVLQIEEHVGFLTTKVVEHDERFDRVDERLDGLTTMVTQIRDAVLPPDQD